MNKLQFTYPVNSSPSESDVLTRLAGSRVLSAPGIRVRDQDRLAQSGTPLAIS